MNYQDILKHRESIVSLSIEDIKILAKINAKLEAIEKSLVHSAKEIDNNLQQRTKNKDDLLMSYILNCEVSIQLLPVEDKNKRGIISHQTAHCTGSDWTESLKGVHDLGTQMNDSRNYNAFADVDYAISGQHHCWLFFVLYAKLHMTWDDILRITSIWSNLEITHHYCVEFGHD